MRHAVKAGIGYKLITTLEKPLPKTYTNSIIEQLVD